MTTSKEIVIKAMKGFEYILAKLQGRDCFNTLVEITEAAKEKEEKKKKEKTLATAEEAKDLANKAATKQPQQR